MQAHMDMYINGTWVAGAGNDLISYNPATGEEIWRGRSATSKQIADAVKAARLAFVPWVELTFEARLNYLHKFVQELTAQQAELANPDSNVEIK